jgi:Amt family ammonium transporter
LAIGVVTAAACNLATKIKFWIHVDDALDVWALHAVGGMVGAFLTGLFADSRVAGFDGLTVIAGKAIIGSF